MNELSEYKISDGYPDVRGWQVKDIDNRVVGKVENLLVNKDIERVVYLDVEVDHSIIDANHDPYGRPANDNVKEFVNKDGESHIIIPIGLVDLNTDSNYVFTDIIDHRTFSETKRYRKGDTIERQYEVQVMDSYERKQLRREEKTDFKIDDQLPNEHRLREIVRDEIRKYHNDNDVSSKRYNDAIADDVVLTDEELESRRRNDDVYDDDQFYRRREFDDKRFRT